MSDQLRAKDVGRADTAMRAPLESFAFARGGSEHDSKEHGMRRANHSESFLHKSLNKAQRLVESMSQVVRKTAGC